MIAIRVFWKWMGLNDRTFEWVKPHNDGISAGETPTLFIFRKNLNYISKFVHLHSLIILSVFPIVKWICVFSMSSHDVSRKLWVWEMGFLAHYDDSGVLLRERESILHCTLDHVGWIETIRWGGVSWRDLRNLKRVWPSSLSHHGMISKVRHWHRTISNKYKWCAKYSLTEQSVNNSNNICPFSSMRHLWGCITDL